MTASTSLTKSILHTICYADIFDYPLTEEELWRWLIGNRCQKSEVIHALEESRSVKKKDGYYFLNGREELLKKRKVHKLYSEQKMHIARRAAALLRLIPTIQLVGLSGSLAWENARVDDDIDFYIITSVGWLWTTRLLATILLDIFRMRRSSSTKTVSNKICLNMFVDASGIELPKNKQNIFTSHEIAGLKCIFCKNNMYTKYKQHNKWIHNYLPNIEHYHSEQRNNEEGNRNYIFLQTIETMLRTLQIRFMKRHRTSENLGEHIIMFHPNDKTEYVLKKFEHSITSVQNLV